MKRRIFYATLIAVGLGALCIGPIVMAGEWTKPAPTVHPVEMTITSGVSDKDLAEGIATAIAGGGHQFDFATFDWQGSVTAAFELDENADAVSFGVGKRWESIDALFHGGYTQMGSSDFIQIGATFRF